MFINRVKGTSFFKDIKGSATLCVMLLLSGIILAESILVEGLVNLNLSHKMNQLVQRNLRSYFSHYDRELATYGLYAVKESGRDAKQMITLGEPVKIDHIRIISSTNLSDQSELNRQIQSQMKFEITSDIVNELLSRIKIKKLTKNINDATTIDRSIEQYKNDYQTYNKIFTNLINQGELLFSERNISIKYMSGSYKLEKINSIIKILQDLYGYELGYKEKYGRSFLLGDEVLRLQSKMTEFFALVKNNKSQSVILKFEKQASDVFYSLLRIYKSKTHANSNSEDTITKQLHNETNRFASLLCSCKSDPLNSKQKINFIPSEIIQHGLKALDVFRTTPSKILDHALVNEFVMRKFTFRLINDYRNPAFKIPHKRPNYEIESILTGHQSCQMSQSTVVLRIFYLRVGIHIIEGLLSTKNSMIISNPWLYALSVVLKSVQSSIRDIQQLNSGQKIPISNKFNIHLQMGYSDYLRIFLYTSMDMHTRLSLIRSTIEWNTGSKFRHLLTAAQLKVRVHTNKYNKMSLLRGGNEFNASFSY